MGRLAIILCFLAVFSGCRQSKAQESVAEENVETSFNPQVRALIDNYSCIIGFEDNKIVFADSTMLVYDDFRAKTHDEALEYADVEDMFSEPYQKTDIPTNDPGRIRSDALFRKLYGSTYTEVSKHLVSVLWQGMRRDTEAQHEQTVQLCLGKSDP